MINILTTKDDKRIPEDVVIVYDPPNFRWVGYWKRKWQSGVMEVSSDIAKKLKEGEPVLMRGMIGSLLKHMEMTMEREGLTNDILGGIGYFEYMHHKIKDAKNLFKNSQFVYIEYFKENKKKDIEFFETNKFKKPYPKASLGLRIAFKENDELVAKGK